jgi:hypothetical protein
MTEDGCCDGAINAVLPVPPRFAAMLARYLLEQYRLRNGLQLFALGRDRTKQVLPRLIEGLGAV